MRVKIVITDSVLSNYPNQFWSFWILDNERWLRFRHVNILPDYVLKHGSDIRECYRCFEADVSIEELLTCNYEETRQWARSIVDKQ